MKALLFLPLIASIAHADELARADLAKLGDPEKALAEVTRIVMGPDRADYALMGYHFLKAGQPAGKPPLYVLCGERNYTSSFRSLGEYEIEEPSEIFGEKHRKVFGRREPSLDYIKDSVLYIFDDKGKEIRPFGGDNYIDGGHLYDFDGDGILDRAGSTNYGLDEAPDHDIRMFELQSVEPKPRDLLRVIFVWHPDSADEANEWIFRCTDADGDGRPEIRFGPKDPVDGENAEPFVFKWDKATGKFSAGEIPKGSHIRVLEAGETLKSIAKAGGLGYPLIGKTDSKETPPAAKSRQPAYEFTSLADRSDKEIAALFKGRERRDFSDGAEGSFPDVIPENLFVMEPKQAALALADANRTAAHRRKFQLAIDDRNGIAPPASGWAQFSWTSSGCYSLSAELFAIRFGEPDPLLLKFGYNSIGVVGRNPWADQPARNLRMVKLSEKEAAYLAQTLFWLDRIRSRSLHQDDDHSISSFSSTADGFSSILLLPTGRDPQELASETDWATSTISGRWDGDYNREVFANLASLLIRTGVPKMLGKRWEADNDTGHHSLMTPTDERLRDRLGADMRAKLAADLAAVLAMDAEGTLPPDVITRLASTAGDEALVSLLPALRKKLAELPAESDEETECRALEKRFERDHFGDPLADEPQEHKDAYKRLTHLREKLRFFRPAILREPLADAVEKLRLASDSSLLKQAFLEKSPHAQWALSLLRRTEPETWAILVSADFATAAAEERRTIFATLAAGHPPAAAAMIPNFNKAERRDLIIEISDFHSKHAPGEFPNDIPVLMELVRDKKQDIYRRGGAMETLAAVDLSESQQEELTGLLVAELRTPQKGEYFSGTLGYALEALASLPHPERHLDLVLSLSHIPKDAFGEGFAAVESMTRNHPDREKILAEFLKTQFVASSGMMNYHFTKALAYDLRILAPEIAAFANDSPDTEDGDGANYSGGNFKTPLGQRYHIAREITALWSEKDEETLARMWIAFVAAHPDDFQEHNEPSAIRQLAAKHIRALPSEARKEAITAILKEIPIPEYYADSLKWLKSLTD
jgi:hypothetical protein